MTSTDVIIVIIVWETVVSSSTMGDNEKDLSVSYSSMCDHLSLLCSDMVNNIIYKCTFNPKYILYATNNAIWLFPYSYFTQEGNDCCVPITYILSSQFMFR